MGSADDGALLAPVTCSIATGLSLGPISFTVLKLLTGRRKEISRLIWVPSLPFRYALLGVE